MKKYFVFSTVLILVIIFCLMGCGDSGTISTPTPIPTTPSITTGSVTGIVLDRDSNKIPGAYVLGTSIENTTSSATEPFVAIADDNGEFSFENIPAGLFRIDCWPSQADYELETPPVDPVCSFELTIVANQTIEEEIRYGYYPKDCDAGFGSIYGQVFENASPIKDAYVEAYVEYKDEKILTDVQSNQFVCLTNPEGYYSLNGIPVVFDETTGEPIPVKVNIWLSTDDHVNNFLNPKATYTVYVKSQMKFWLEGQVGNMVSKK